METSSIKTPFLGWVSILNSFVSFLIFYILSYLLSKTMGCFSRRLMSSASDRKLFCGVCSAFKSSFDEFVGEKVVSPSYSSAILAPPSSLCYSIFESSTDMSSKPEILSLVLIINKLLISSSRVFFISVPVFSIPSISL